MAWDCAEPNVPRKFDWIDKLVAGGTRARKTPGAPGMGLRSLSTDIP
jgi:hypothetical protein